MASIGLPPTDGPLCSSCTNKFISPTKQPGSDDDGHTLDERRDHRKGRGILASVYAGCRLCTSIWSRLSALLRHEAGSLEDAKFFSALKWNSSANEYCALICSVVVNERRGLFDSGLLQFPHGGGSFYPELFEIDLNPESGEVVSAFTYCTC